MARAPKFHLSEAQVPSWALYNAADQTAANSTKKQALKKKTVLRVDEAAICLSVSEKTVRRLIKAKTLSAIRIGRLVRIKSTEIERFIAAAAIPSDTAQKIKKEDGDE
jgi:excisionase family DNA binding protein